VPPVHTRSRSSVRLSQGKYMPTLTMASRMFANSFASKLRLAATSFNACSSVLALNSKSSIRLTLSARSLIDLVNHPLDSGKVHQDFLFLSLFRSPKAQTAPALTHLSHGLPPEHLVRSIRHLLHAWETRSLAGTFLGEEYGRPGRGCEDAEAIVANAIAAAGGGGPFPSVAD
jgi:hypothetical protein